MDLDRIARIYPVLVEGKSFDAMRTAIRRYNAKRKADDVYGSSKDAGEGAEEPTIRDDEDEFLDEFLDMFLDVRFSHPPLTSDGFVVGNDETADLVVAGVRGLSRRHFGLTFNDESRPIIRNYSKSGIKITVGDSKNQKESLWLQQGYHQDWEVWSPPHLQNSHITVAAGNCRFRIVMQDQNTESVAYRENVARFRKRCNDRLTPLAHSSIERASGTKAASPLPEQKKKRPPGKFWKRPIGEGSFGTVSRVFNVFTKEEFALKEPVPNQEFTLEKWQAEARIVETLQHPNIVRLVYADFDDGHPQLFFEYVPDGNLVGRWAVSTTEHSKQIATQLLSAVDYLHDSEVKVVHRDIKPANILVQYWGEDKVHVKLADFGFSTRRDILSSMCGTPFYEAPEILNRDATGKYGPKVDVWSLGVVLLELECGPLPGRTATSQDSWAEHLVKFAQDVQRRKKCDFLEFILDHMLQINPTQRGTALECYYRVIQLFDNSSKSSAYTEAGAAASRS